MPSKSGTASVIHIAAAEGLLSFVILAINIYPNLLNKTDGFGNTPLIYAARRGQLEVIRYLTTQNDLYFSPCTRYSRNKIENGRNALHWAAVMGHAEVALALLLAGMNPTSRARQFQAVHFAAKYGKLKVLKVLIEIYPQLLNETDLHDQTPLQCLEPIRKI